MTKSILPEKVETYTGARMDELSTGYQEPLDKRLLEQKKLLEEQKEIVGDKKCF
ncbi:hypothetical protein GTO27_02525 [Candidatus Bathyarchaeota archaeon]|nr:hypothetical protein [Candidatus Bathyarchaeota archaeon]